ncbi:MAG: hypothetical protein Q9M36_12610 [Sulfurovum sp.]|nr:hypothetical protein [Sulfurovum sp.]
MQITSNDKIHLDAFYSELRRNRIEGVSAEEVEVDGGMGVDLIVYIDVEILLNLADIFRILLGNPITMGSTIVYLKNKNQSQEIIDIEVLEDKSKFDNDSEIYIEYEKR